MNIRDLIEILFFVSCFYYLSRWLSQDKDKKLLHAFYGYCILILVSSAAELSTINAFLFLFSPAIIIGFMLMHQTILQRNMVALKNITAAKITFSDWLSPIIRLAITALHSNKELLILIEHTDMLMPYITTEYAINAPITNDLLFMIAAHQMHQGEMLWIRTDGIIRGVNSRWKESDETDWVTDALFYTSTNDSILIHIDGAQENCAIAYQGAIYQGLSINEIDHIIRKKIQYHLSDNFKGYDHGITNKKARSPQHNA